MRKWCLLLLLAFPAFAKDKFQKPGPVHLDRDGQKWAEKTLKKLSLEEKIGQLFMPRLKAEFLSEDSPYYTELRNQIVKYHVGGFIMTVPYDPPFLYRTGPYEAAMLLNRLQSDSKLPLIMAADFERGVTMRVTGGTDFPAAMAFGAAGKTEYAESFGRISAIESRALGIQWNFFPDTDVNSNPANPIINTRSFSEDPAQVGEMAAAYIRGSHSGGMLTSAKHFPGHGDTATDSHLGVAQVSGDMARLKSVELPPFQKAVDAGVDSVMVGHVSVPALDSDPNRVATTSPGIISDVLRKQIGFKGLVVTDGLDMGALTRLYAADPGRASVDAFKAGNDLLLIPADLGLAFEAMMKAVHSGEVTQPQIDASVLKILQAKASVGLDHAKLVDPEQLPRILGTTENVSSGQKTAEDAITLVRDNGKLLPLKHEGTVAAGPAYKAIEAGSRLLVVIFSEDTRTESGRGLERQIRSRVPDVRVMYIDQRVANAMSDQVMNAVNQAQAVVAAVYMVPSAGKATGTGVTTGSLLTNILQAAAEKTAVVATGSPYIAKDFPAVQNYLCTFSGATVSETAAVKALFGEIAIHGHLPVTIPDIAARGAGIERPSIH
ncbi:MAG TPA: glycoside hydrolase family 3 N-terminal domain-containing protein [Terriglobales bacterium]|nr:glycoside hydrolase family 3 N-terminal domain-containing protein [Terriglobales bacterium]